MGNFFDDAAKWYRKYMIVRIIFATALVYLFMHFGLPLVLPFLLAFLFVKGMYPLIHRLSLHRKGLRGLMTGFLLLLLGCIPILLLIVLYRAGSMCITNGVMQFSVLQDSLRGILHNCCCYLEAPMGISSANLEKMILDYGGSISQQLGESMLPAVTSYAAACVKFCIQVGILWAVFYLFSILLARDYAELRSRLSKRKEAETLRNIYDRTVRMLCVYLKAQLIILSVIGGICSLVFWWAGFPMPFFWGYLAGFLDVLPFIGTGLTLFPIAVYQLIMGNVMLAAVMVLLYVLCYFLRQFMEPRLIGKGMDIHPLIMIMSIYIGVHLFGIGGIIVGPISFLLIRELAAL